MKLIPNENGYIYRPFDGIKVKAPTEPGDFSALIWNSWTNLRGIGGYREGSIYCPKDSTVKMFFEKIIFYGKHYGGMYIQFTGSDPVDKPQYFYAKGKWTDSSSYYGCKEINPTFDFNLLCAEIDYIDVGLSEPEFKYDFWIYLKEPY